MSSAVDGGVATTSAAVYTTYRSLVESADRKFAHVRDLPPRGSPRHTDNLIHNAFRKAFVAYTRLWHFQRDHRAELVASGLRRWEIGEIASRIGQLYYSQYLRTSETRFLVGSYVFYEAILSRGYFKFELGGNGGGKSDLGLRYKELRFYARFLVVAILLERKEAVKELSERFRRLVEESKSAFPEISFREWKLVMQEINRFLKVDATFASIRSLRYSLLLDSHPSSLPHIARFEAKAKKVLKLQDALITSYHRNEVKMAELTLDTYRMLQSLEWEPNGSFYQMPTTEKNENGVFTDQNGASGVIDINLAADMTDSSLPSNSQKIVLYHPTVSQLIAVLAMICEELPSESVMLVYLSASGHFDQNNANNKDGSKYLSASSKLNPSSQSSSEKNKYLDEPPGRQKLNECAGGYLCFGSRGSGGGFSNFYPEDLIPFTRKPLFVIIDSDNSEAFKAVHGAERGEPAALLLSPAKPSSLTAADLPLGGSQFTLFLTSPLLAFCQLVGFPFNIDSETYHKAEIILSLAFSEWEVILCTSDGLEQVWAQVVPDSFLRRLIIRFIFCRTVLSLFRPDDNGREYLPLCLPHLPESVSPESLAVQSHIFVLAETLDVVGYFCFLDGIRNSGPKR